MGVDVDTRRQRVRVSASHPPPPPSPPVWPRRCCPQTAPNGAKEAIKVHTGSCPKEFTAIYFVITSYGGAPFNGVESLVCGVRHRDGAAGRRARPRRTAHACPAPRDDVRSAWPTPWGMGGGAGLCFDFHSGRWRPPPPPDPLPSPDPQIPSPPPTPRSPPPPPPPPGRWRTAGYFRAAGVGQPTAADTQPTAFWRLTDGS